jgi:hypothetical protein
MAYLYSIQVSYENGSQGFSIQSCDGSAGDAIAYALQAAGSGAAVQTVNRMPAPVDLTKITVTLPEISGEHGAAIPPASVTASGGRGTYSYTAYGLPAGLSCNASTGQISGTPAVAGSYAYAVAVADSQGNIGIAARTITIN